MDLDKDDAYLLMQALSALKAANETALYHQITDGVKKSLYQDNQRIDLLTIKLRTIMDKPTSREDVIKSLPALTGDEKYRAATVPLKRVDYATIKPVFDKMLASLKAAKAWTEDRGSTDLADAFWHNLDATIKEAEELGL